tara:strand:+ start:413 stop:526 length:114 start_codon:yes stop_codon:yes gene_type:complete
MSAPECQASLAELERLRELLVKRVIVLRGVKAEVLED